MDQVGRPGRRRSDQREDAVDDLVGAWALSSLIVDEACGDEGTAASTPLGVRPHGMLLYAADGWMSALLAGGADVRPAAVVSPPVFQPAL